MYIIYKWFYYFLNIIHTWWQFMNKPQYYQLHIISLPLISFRSWVTNWIRMCDWKIMNFNLMLYSTCYIIVIAVAFTFFSFFFFNSEMNMILIPNYLSYKIILFIWFILHLLGMLTILIIYLCGEDILFALRIKWTQFWIYTKLSKPFLKRFLTICI